MRTITNTQEFILDLVSVIVPIYNSEQYLHQCIDSIVNQSYKNIEIILITGDSTDNSSKICDEYALSENRIRVIPEKNSGPAAARNTGIENSKGEFIFFVDSDDFIENDAIKLLIENYRRTRADIIIGDFNKINDNNPDSGHNRVFSNSKLLTKQDIIDYTRWYLKKPNKFPLFAQSWGRLFKSSIIKNNNIYFNADLRTFEDVAFNFDYLNYTDKVFFLKETIYNHLIHNDYISATMAIGANPRKLFGYKQALTKMKDFLENCNSDADTRKEVGHADVCFTIIQLVRICGQIDDDNKKKIYELIDEIINDLNFRDNLQFYSPSRGDSRILPILMKLKLVWPIIWVSEYKAHKRYK
jgi:glycosyltransferase involved in cell wall biosynthesis